MLREDRLPTNGDPEWRCEAGRSREHRHLLEFCSEETPDLRPIWMFVYAVTRLGNRGFHVDMSALFALV
jgi:hypothetical protein